jgi:hypothetical protein
MYNENATTRIGDSPDKVPKKLPGIKLVNADAAFDGDGDRDGVLHGLEAVGHQVLVFHKACAEVSVLHPVRRAAAVQVHFAKACAFHHLTCRCKFCGVASAQLQHRGHFAVFVAQEQFRVLAVQKSCRYHHLAVEQNVLGNQPQKVPLMAIGAVQHGSDRKASVEIQVHMGKYRI